MKSKTRNLKGVLVLIIGIIFIFIGANRGEISTVLLKAVRICLECIGIG